MICITRDMEFIDDSQQQNRKDFVIGLQKWAPRVQNNKSGGPNLQTLPSWHHNGKAQLPDCHRDDTKDKARVPASQNCKLWQPIIKCKTQVVGRLQSQLWIIKNTTDFPSNPYNSCIFQRIRGLQRSGKFEISKLGFRLSNFDKSWIAEMT